MQMLIDAARLQRWLVFHVFDSRRSEPGFPDLIAIRYGELLVWELKTQKGRLSPQQDRWLDAWSGVGAEVAVLRPEPKAEYERSYDWALERLSE